jgi:hypothetical protein
MIQEISKPESTSIDSENIFDEFTNSEDIRNDIAKVEERTRKDMYYYMKKIVGFFYTINVIIFMILIFGSLYIFIQEKETKTEYKFLSSICNIFLGTNELTSGTCYWVTPILREYKWLLSKKIVNQSNELFPILGDIYSIENFNLSKKVSFLLEKEASRLKPLEILVAFDELKNTFSPTDKEEISCYNLYVTDNMLNMTCDAFSSDWNTDIVTLNKGNIEILPWWGTSISRASSFIYFIENYRESVFTIILKPESLTSTTIQSGPYTQKTTFNLEMRYALEENLPF